MNEEHLKILQQGVAAWNAWRRKEIQKELSARPNLSEANLYSVGLSEADLVRPDLSGADLSGADLSEANLVGAKLRGANLSEANLTRVNLSSTFLVGANLNNANLSGGANLSDASLNEVNFSRANLNEANLRRVDLSGANLCGASLREANLYCSILREVNLVEADLTGVNLIAVDLTGADLHGAKLVAANLASANLDGANLIEADLMGVTLVGTNLTGADLTGCRIYGISAWGLDIDENTKQRNLIITPPNKPEITVDNIEVAQFVYLLFHNEKIRDVIETITTKAVLILGRFTTERKAVLDALRDELRKRDLLPIIFDFSIPTSRDVTETIKVLAGLARFVVADITDATEVRVELHNIIPDFTKLPVQPILLRGKGEFVSLPGHLNSYPWVLPTFEYDSQEKLIADLDERVIRPAENKVQEIRQPQLR